MKKKVAILSLFLLIIDRISKMIIDYKFNLQESKTIIKNFFSITKVYNDGASFSLFSGYSIILIIVAIIMLIFLMVYQKNYQKNTKNIITFSLIYAGITGNLIDRIIYGYVIDFLDFIIINYDYPVFNFADICIVIGIFLLIIAIWKGEDKNEIKSS